VGVLVDLALVDQALFAFVDEFDGVLNGEDVEIAVLVDIVDHRRQGGTFARTGGAGHQHQTAGQYGYFAENIAQPQIFKGQHPRGNGTEYTACAAILVECIDPEARHTGHLKGKVCFEKFLVIPALLVIHDVINEPVHFLMLQRRQIDPANIAVDPDHRRQASGQVKVGRPVFGTEGKQFGNIHGDPGKNVRWLKGRPGLPLCYYPRARSSHHRPRA